MVMIRRPRRRRCRASLLGGDPSKREFRDDDVLHHVDPGVVSTFLKSDLDLVRVKAVGSEPDRARDLLDPGRVNCGAVDRLGQSEAVEDPPAGEDAAGSGHVVCAEGEGGRLDAIKEKDVWGPEGFAVADGDVAIEEGKYYSFCTIIFAHLIFARFMNANK